MLKLENITYPITFKTSAQPFITFSDAHNGVWANGDRSGLGIVYFIREHNKANCENDQRRIYSYVMEGVTADETEERMWPVVGENINGHPYAYMQRSEAGGYVHYGFHAKKVNALQGELRALKSTLKQQISDIVNETVKEVLKEAIGDIIKDANTNVFKPHLDNVCHHEVDAALARMKYGEGWCIDKDGSLIKSVSFKPGGVAVSVFADAMNPEPGPNEVICVESSTECFTVGRRYDIDEISFESCEITQDNFVSDLEGKYRWHAARARGKRNHYTILTAIGRSAAFKARKVE